VQSPAESLNSTQELTAEEIFKKSVREFENRLKKNKTLVEYLYFKDPSNPVYQKAYRMWIEWKQRKTIALTQPLIGYARYQGVEGYNDVYKAVEFFKKHKYVFFFFYRPDCPYCIATKPQVRVLEQLGLKVYWLNAYTDPEMFERWRVSITPTLIAVSKYDKKAVRREPLTPTPCWNTSISA
jgi:thiol-disulfide isomerase/thioredoxin